MNVWSFLKNLFPTAESEPVLMAGGPIGKDWREYKKNVLNEFPPALADDLHSIFVAGYAACFDRLSDGPYTEEIGDIDQALARYVRMIPNIDRVDIVGPKDLPSFMIIRGLSPEDNHVLPN